MPFQSSSRVPSSGRSGRIGSVTALGLLALLALPVYALSRLTSFVDWRLLCGVPLGVSAFTFLIYRADKRRAEEGEWRVPESTLHLAELMGGWPGAFLAQRRFRHKISKTSYQCFFWSIVLVHQAVAIDSLAGWRFSSEALHFIQAKAA